MKLPELEQGLRASANGETWSERIATYFSSFPLHYGHGTDNASDEAYWLVRAVHGWDGERWRTRPDPDRIPRLLDIARRRVEQRRPLAYLLGEAWFAGLRFEIDEQVLVPRSPLAELIEACFAPWCALHAGDRVLDVGTGSGCLAIACAVHCPGVLVDATEVSQAALAIARANAASVAPGLPLTFIEADLLPGDRGPYRLIMSNPPYVPTARIAELPAEYGHEPRQALCGGEDGLDIVRRLLARASESLAPNGVLIVEVGEAQDAFVAAFPELPVTWLDFERGGEGVFVISREELTGHSAS